MPPHFRSIPLLATFLRSGGGGGRGRGKRLLNRGMNLSKGNYIGKRQESAGGSGAAEAAAAPKEDDHPHEAALGFALHTDGADRLGWLMNLNQARQGDSIVHVCVRGSIWQCGVQQPNTQM